jgi:hypothetical protein
MKKLTLAALLLSGVLVGAAPPQGTISLSLTGVGALVISAPLGGPAPSPSTLTLTNTGGGKLNWTMAISPASPWLSVSPDHGTLNHAGSIDLSVGVLLSGLAAGDYQANIVVSDPNSTNGSQSCGVLLHVLTLPELSLTPTSSSWTAPQGTNPPSQPLSVKNVGGGSLTWSAVSDVGWLSGSPAGATLLPGESTPVTLSVVTALAPGVGTWTGHWTVTSSQATNSPQVFTATFTVSAVPVISLSPASLIFDAPQGGANPSPAPVTLTNAGFGSMPWGASSDAPSWLSVSPASGTLASGDNQILTISINTNGLAEGTYLAAIHVTGTGASNTPQAVSVTLNVNASPKIGVNPKSFSFSVSVDHTVSSASAASVTNTGSGTLNWGAATTAGWLGYSPGGGALTALASEPLLLTANGSGMAPGFYTTTLEVSDPSALNSPQTIAVDLTVTPSDKPTSAPAGQCGLLGAELLAPALAAGWLRRRARNAGRMAR